MVMIKTKYLQQYVIFFAISVILALSAESVWLSNNPTIVYTCAGVVLGIIWLNYICRQFSKAQINIILIYWVLGIFYMLLNGEGSLTGWILFVVVYPLCFSLHFKLYNDEEMRLLKMFVFTTSIIAAVSLILWFLSSVLKILSPTGLFVIKWGGIRIVPSYFNLHFITQGAHETLGSLSVAARNSAIFSEAPVASFVFSLALLLNWFWCKYRKKFCNIVLILAILSTYSTTGKIILILISMSFMLNYNVKTRMGIIFKYIIIIAGIGIAVHLGYTLLQVKMVTESGTIRMRDLTGEIQAFQNNIILGHGFGKFTYGSSNSITALLADGGIILWGFYYIPIILTIVKNLIMRKIDFFTIIFVCMFAMTVMHYTIISIFMVTMFWRNLLRK